MRAIAILAGGLLSFSLSAWAQNYVPGEMIVKFRGKGGGFSASGPLGKLESSQKISLKASFDRFNMKQYSLKAGEDLQKALSDVRRDPAVEYAEPNFIINKLDMQSKAGAMSFTRQSYLNSQSYSATEYSQSGAETKVEEAWAASSSLSQIPTRVVVAVIDTGVDYNHEVFTSSNAIWINQGEIPGNGVDDDRNGYVDDNRGWNFAAGSPDPMDDEGHGTHVAGIIVGATQDILADSLEESKVKIMPLKFLGPDGSGSTSDAIAAIHYAVDNGAHILNNSWGGKSYSAALHEAVAYTYQNETLFVAAAGNWGEDNDITPVYPASYDTPNIISVAASNDWDYLASFSNFGANSVHVAAPGVSILSTFPDHYYGYSSGTSMAAPLVAGIAALAYREALDLTGYQVKGLIINGADEVTRLQGRLVYPIRVNALESINLAFSEVGKPPYQPGYNLKLQSAGGTRGLASEADAGGCGLITTMYSEAIRNGEPGSRGGKGSGGGAPIGLIMVLLLAPALIFQLLRESKKSGKDQRRHARFKMESQIKVAIGDKELVGNMSTISLGGCSFNADALLEKGGVVTMQIASPDGKEVLEVAGQVVWSAEKKAYGVRFGEMQATKLKTIDAWTRGLLKAN